MLALSTATNFNWRDFMDGVKFFQSIPPPEKSLENTQRQEKEIKSIVENLRLKIKDLNEEKQEISELINDYSTKLETLEAELEMLSEEKNILESIVVEDDESFLDNLPFFYESVKKSADLKLKDVKEVTLLVKKQKRHLEICMKCENKIKDEKGRKSSVKHYHFQDETSFSIYENDNFIYEPILCESCLETLLPIDIFREFLLQSSNSPIVTCSKGVIDYGYLVHENFLDNKEYSKLYEIFKIKLKEIDRIKSIENLMIKRDSFV